MPTRRPLGTIGLTRLLPTTTPAVAAATFACWVPGGQLPGDTTWLGTDATVPIAVRHHEGGRPAFAQAGRAAPIEAATSRPQRNWTRGDVPELLMISSTTCLTSSDDMSLNL